MKCDKHPSSQGLPLGPNEILFGKVQLTSTVPMLAIVISVSWPIPYFTDEKTGPERAGGLCKTAQLASNQARAELSFPDFCRHSHSLKVLPSSQKQRTLAFPLSLAWEA